MATHPPISRIFALTSFALAALFSGTPAHAAYEYRASIKTLRATQGGAPAEQPPAPGKLEAGSLSFDNVALDSSVSKSIVVSNTGQSSLTGVGLQEATLPSNVSIVSNSCGTDSVATTLAPGGACQIVLSWSPVNAGALEASLVVSSAESASLSVPIQGTAYPASGVSAWLDFESMPFTDRTGKNVTSVGSGGTFYATAAVGQGAVSLSSGGYTLPLAASDFKSQDFTVEAWVKPTAGLPHTILSRDNNENVNWGNLVFAVNPDGKVHAYCNPSASSSAGRVWVASTTTVLPPNAWAHVAWTRQGSAWRMFINGRLTGTATGSCAFRSADVTRIGHGLYSSSPAGYFSGQMDQFRIVIGRSLYNADFTPARSGW